MSEKVYLVDGSGYIFRAYYAVAPLTTSDGFPTNALYGYTRMLIKLLNDAESEHVVIVFDTAAKNFRHALYDQYKANRAECPEDLAKQMPYFRDISRALGLQVLEKEGYEADDIIGALAHKLSNADIETIIISGDKDLMQLVTEKVTIWDAMKDKHIGFKEVREKFGVTPDKVVEVLALMGDSSDNIPGVAGIGPKTAQQLIEKYNDIESVIAAIDEIRDSKGLRNKKKIADAIEADPEILRLSRKLVEIDINMPLTINSNGETLMLSELENSKLADVLVRKEPRDDLLSEFAEKFEFSSLFSELNLNSHSIQKEERDYKTVLEADFDLFIEKLKAQELIAFDIESTSLNVLEAEIVGLSFCWNSKEAFYVPIGHNEQGQVERAYAIQALSEILGDKKIKKCGQNLKYDISVLSRIGVEVRGVYFDTMLAGYLINPDRRSNNLTALAGDYLSMNLLEYDQVIADKKCFSEVSIADATYYAAEDAHVAFLLMERLAPILKERDLENVFYNIEIPLISVLSKMEMTGVALDVSFLNQLSVEYGERLDKIRKELFELAGEEFNMNSPKQLSVILFDKLGISTKGLKKTKTGAISTSQAVLEQLRDEHPLPAKILEYRSLFKLKNTYIDVLPEQVSKITHRLHTKYNQAVTGTGRLSSSDPNLQNIPIRTEEGKKIRKAFIAPKGRKLIVADYSQIELRILAHLSEDQNLIQAFLDGTDIHTKTAREILHLGDDEQVTSDERRMGKTINFGIIYGMSGFRLGRELGIPIGVANEYIENYFNQYPGVKAYFDQIEEDARTKGFVTTLFGRKRNTADIDATGRDRDFVMRAALNAPIQGTAADLIKLAMIEVSDAIIGKPISMTMQVHDELVFECDDDYLDKARELVVDTMEGVADLRVPLKVDVNLGINWNEAH
ncbi:MAG: DNA polymerase I [Deltaproteobacteria bacterium]|nr:DNA polymerase I [Deltaproteobacteria bacterium]